MQKQLRDRLSRNETSVWTQSGSFSCRRSLSLHLVFHSINMQIRTRLNALLWLHIGSRWGIKRNSTWSGEMLCSFEGLGGIFNKIGGTMRWWRHDRVLLLLIESWHYRTQECSIQTPKTNQKPAQPVTNQPDFTHSSSPQAPPLWRATRTKLMKFLSEFCIFSIAASSTFVD